MVQHRMGGLKPLRSHNGLRCCLQCASSSLGVLDLCCFAEHRVPINLTECLRTSSARHTPRVRFHVASPVVLCTPDTSTLATTIHPPRIDKVVILRPPFCKKFQVFKLREMRMLHCLRKMRMLHRRLLGATPQASALVPTAC